MVLRNFFFAAREWNDRQTVDGRNSIKFKTTFVREHTAYLTLNEWVNTIVVILPNGNKIHRAVRLLLWSPSFPSCLGNVFTATNSKYRQLSTGKILLNVEVNRSFSRTLKRNALNSCIEYVCEFCRSTTGGFQIPLPTGLGNWVSWGQTLTFRPLPSITSLESAKI